MSYQDYLKTDDWDKKRKRTYKKSNYYCQSCKHNCFELHAHHIKYAKNLEKVSVAQDLMCLCKDCHFLLHKLIKAGVLMDWNKYRTVTKKPRKKTYRKYIKRNLSKHIAEKRNREWKLNQTL